MNHTSQLPKLVPPMTQNDDPLHNSVKKLRFFSQTCMSKVGRHFDRRWGERSKRTKEKQAREFPSCAKMPQKRAPAMRRINERASKPSL